jgi:hypothetical protein
MLQEICYKYVPVSQEICPPPKKIWPPGPNFLGNLDPLGAIFPRKYDPTSEIWPPQKHSLLYRYKLGNCEASSKTKILKVFVSIYS